MPRLLGLLIVLFAAVGQADESWTLRTDDAAFSPRDSMGEVVYDNKIWLMGGYAPQRVNEVWASSDGTNWTMATAAAPWAKRNLPGTVVYGGRMWIMGGINGLGSGGLNDVWSSIDGVDWTQATAAAPWSPRGAISPVVFQNKMWVTGGLGALDGTDHHNDIWTSTDGSTWNQVTAAAPWTDRGMHTTLVHDDKMWVIAGGVYDQNQPNNIGAEYNDVWVTEDGENWTQVLEHAPFDGRRFFGATVYDNRMWVVAGFSDDHPHPWHNSNRNDVWSSVDGVHWEQMATVPWGPRHESSVVTFDNELWVIGGFANGFLVNESWSYRAVPEPGSLMLIGITGFILMRRKSR